jgi:serine/threonine-protein kinase
MSHWRPVALYPEFAKAIGASGPASTARTRGRIVLDPRFRYVHEPLQPTAPQDRAIPFIGAEEQVEALTERLAHSIGGAFLVTGFRGAGKSTVVNHALDRLSDRIDATLLPIRLNIARPIAPAGLLFEIVRRLFEALVDYDILQKLDPKVARQLLVAYMRTSLSFKENRGHAIEHSVQASLSPGATGLSNPVAATLGRLLPQVTGGRKTTQSMATEASLSSTSSTS